MCRYQGLARQSASRIAASANMAGGKSPTGLIGDGAAMRAAQPHLRVDRQVGGVRHRGEHALPAGQRKGRVPNGHLGIAGQRQHDHLVRLGVEFHRFTRG